MLHRIFTILHNIKPAGRVYAHCDIPCGIYDPHAMQLAAHTVIRMTQLIQELEPPSFPTPDVTEAKGKLNSLARYVQVKEEHAEICKKEMSILWGDYFKPEHLEEYPDLHGLVWKGLKTAGKTKHEVNMQAAEELLAVTQEIAEIFWKTKGAEPTRSKSFYPTEREIVYPSGK